MEVRAKKALGQHFLTDQGIAQNIVGALQGSPVLEVGPGMGVLTQYLLTRHCVNTSTPLHPRGGLRGIPLRLPESLRSDGFSSEATGSEGSTASLRSAPPFTSFTVPPLNVPRVAVVSPSGAAASVQHLKVVEIDKESVAYLKKHYPELGGGLIEGDFLKMDLSGLFPGQFSIIGNFPYNISSQIFFKIIDNRDLVPEVVCMIQKEVAQRIAEKPGTKTYGILSVFLQAWYDIEYLFTVSPGAFNPPPKVQSAVIRLTRNSRTSLGCDEKLFRTVVKTAFGQRRKTLRNSLKPILRQAQVLRPVGEPVEPQEPELTSDPVFDLRPERLSVEDFIDLTLKLRGTGYGLFM